jgi:hypothetical protein
MSLNIFEKAFKANDKAALLEYRMGDPQRKQLLFRYTGLNPNNTPFVNDILISPPPKITSPPRRLIDLVVGNENSGVTVTATDRVAEISLSVPFSTFVRLDNARVRCVIEPTFVNGVLQVTAQTNFYRVLFVDDSKCDCFLVVLRKEKDK